MTENKIKEEIIAFMTSLGAEECSIAIANNTWTISVSKMYNGLGNLISFKSMKWISNLLNTDEIDLHDEKYIEGCDSCDYGSSHSVDFICKKVFI